MRQSTGATATRTSSRARATSVTTSTRRGRRPPTPISANWPALPAEFQSGLNAVVNWGDGNAYFFKGSRYLRYKIATDVVDVAPTAISANWPALPAEFISAITAPIVWSFTHYWSRLSRARRSVYAMEWLIDVYGYPVNGVAGLVGNPIAESSVIPSRIEGSPEDAPTKAKDFHNHTVEFDAETIMNRDALAQVGPQLPGVGLAQWTSAARRGRVFTHPFGGAGLGYRALFSMDAQLDYLATELPGSFAGVQHVLTTATVAVDQASDEVSTISRSRE